MSQSDDFSTEAGKFAGAFVVTMVAETINEIFDRKNVKNDEIVASLKDLKPLVDQLSFFKELHSFSQEFIDRVSGDLFGDKKNGGDYFDRADVIRDAWENHYAKGYKPRLDSHIDLISAFSTKGRNKNIEDVSSCAHTRLIQKCITELKRYVPHCLTLSMDFVNAISDTSDIALSDELFKDISAWKDGKRRNDLVRDARYVLGYADDNLARLVDILDDTFTYGIIKKLP